ncbi:MAG TPA: hypothetical protein VL096_20785, partial [Pirellulaceae bacterium]|nr:hypothetical protein [Pirellulaceae bacterium]
ILQWRSQVPALAQRQQATAARDAAIAQLQREAPGIEERIRQLQDELAALQEREATTTQICLKHAAGIAALRELVPEHVKRVVSRRRRDIKNRYQLSELDTELNFANGLRQLVEGKPDEHSALAVAQTRWPDLIEVLPADGTRLFRAAPGVTWPKFVQRARVYLANEVPPLAAKKAAAVAELQAELEGVDAPLNCLVPA